MLRPLKFSRCKRCRLVHLTSDPACLHLQCVGCGEELRCKWIKWDRLRNRSQENKSSGGDGDDSYVEIDAEQVRLALMYSLGVENNSDFATNKSDSPTRKSISQEYKAVSPTLISPSPAPQGVKIGDMGATGTVGGAVKCCLCRRAVVGEGRVLRAGRTLIVVCGRCGDAVRPIERTAWVFGGVTGPGAGPLGRVVERLRRGGEENEREGG